MSATPTNGTPGETVMRTGHMTAIPTLSPAARQRKCCPRCGKVKPLSAFHRKGQRRQGYCKECSCAYYVAWCAARPDKLQSKAEWLRAFRATPRGKVMSTLWKERCKLRKATTDERRAAIEIKINLCLAELARLERPRKEIA